MNDIVSGPEERIKRYYSCSRKLYIGHAKCCKGPIFDAAAALKTRGPTIPGYRAQQDGCADQEP